MARGRQKFPRLNLARYNATHVSFVCSLDWTDEVASRLRDLPFTADKQFIGVATYKPRNTMPHYMQETALLNEERSELRVSVQFTTDELPLRRGPEQFRGGGQLLLSLAQLPGPTLLHCHVGFEYSGDNETTVYPLPAHTDLRSMPFDEIRGIRGVKLAEDGSDELAYSFVLDQPNKRRIYLNTVFSLTSGISDKAPGEILEFGYNIAQQLVISTSSKEG